MTRFLTFLIGLTILATSAQAEVMKFPASFRTESIDANGTKIYVRSGGTGPAVLLLHGFGDTGSTMSSDAGVSGSSSRRCSGP